MYPVKTCDYQNVDAKCVETYSYMLQHVFHRFSLVELKTRGWKGFSNVLTAFARVFQTKPTYAEVFISYDVLKTNNAVQKFQSLLHDTKKILSVKTTPLQGIHLDLWEFLGIIEYFGGKGLTARYYPFFEGDNEPSVSAHAENILKMARLTRMQGIPIGVEMDWQVCKEILRKFPGSAFLTELLEAVNYIVCKLDYHEIEDHMILHSERPLHMYLSINRIFKHIWPQIDVLFSINANFDLNEDLEKTEEFLEAVLRHWKFAEAYKIKFFILNAFDTEVVEAQYGWWGIENLTDLLNPNTYVEKVPGT